MSAESRSTTRVMPSGPIPGSVGPQPPTCSAIVPCAVGQVQQHARTPRRPPTARPG